MLCTTEPEHQPLIPDKGKRKTPSVNWVPLVSMILSTVAGTRIRQLRFSKVAIRKIPIRAATPSAEEASSAILLSGIVAANVFGSSRFDRALHGRSLKSPFERLTSCRWICASLAGPPSARTCQAKSPEILIDFSLLRTALTSERSYRVERWREFFWFHAESTTWAHSRSTASSVNCQRQPNIGPLLPSENRATRRGSSVPESAV